jgi:hypothetical protein
MPVREGHVLDREVDDPATVDVAYGAHRRLTGQWEGRPLVERA